MAGTPPPFDDLKLLRFLTAQIEEFGGKVEIDGGLWTLFAVPADDDEANALARYALGSVRFAYDSGQSEDDAWNLYYVDTANRADAIFWLHDQRAALSGEIRAASPAQSALINSLSESTSPHRVAQQLVEMHARGELSAGVIRDPSLVRALIDRLHLMEPLFYPAFQSLLANHLVDMVVLFQKIISEDIALENDIVKGSLSRDPFLQKRQDAAAEIRNILIRFFIINPIDQMKNVLISNPYSVFMDVSATGDGVQIVIEGNKSIVPRGQFLKSIQTTRRNLYRGGQFSNFNTQVPWMNEEIANSFRFIKARLDSRRDIPPLDGLYMIERAIDG